MSEAWRPNIYPSREQQQVQIEKLSAALSDMEAQWKADVAEMNRLCDFIDTQADKLAEAKLKAEQDHAADWTARAIEAEAKLREYEELLREWRTADPYRHDWMDFEERVDEALTRSNENNETL